MSELDPQSRPVHENLDTAYTNLAALLRFLREHDFEGRVHVELEDYDADVYLKSKEQPRVRERNYETGREAEGEEALQRLLVRASEPGGRVSVYEHNAQVQTGDLFAMLSQSTETSAESAGSWNEEKDWQDLVRLTGELIGTIERAALSAGADFAKMFNAVRLSMADDYSFLDPAAGRFDYANGVVQSHGQPNTKAYVSSISEAMRRVVDRIATGPRSASIRERVALELAVLARRRQAQLTKFKLTPQLDRIAGTKVL